MDLVWPFRAGLSLVDSVFDGPKDRLWFEWGKNHKIGRKRRSGGRRY